MVPIANNENVVVKHVRVCLYSLTMSDWPMFCWPVGEVDRFCLSSGLKVLELKLNLPSWLQTSECLTRNTSSMSPEVLASNGSWK